MCVTVARTEGPVGGPTVLLASSAPSLTHTPGHTWLSGQEPDPLS